MSCATVTKSHRRNGSVGIMGYDLAVVGGSNRAVTTQLMIAAANKLEERLNKPISVLFVADERLADEKIAASILEDVAAGVDNSLGKINSCCQDFSQPASAESAASLCGDSLQMVVVMCPSTCVEWWGESARMRVIEDKCLPRGRDAIAMALHSTAALLHSFLPLLKGEDARAAVVIGVSSSSSFGSALETAAAAAAEAFVMCTLLEHPMTVCRMAVDSVPSAGKLAGLCNKAVKSILDKDQEVLLVVDSDSKSERAGGGRLSVSMSMGSFLPGSGDLQDEITEPPPIDESTLGSGLLKAVYSDDKNVFKNAMKGIRKGDDVVAETDSHDRNALHICAWQRHESMLGQLLKKKPPANIKDKSGWTPLMYAIKSGCVKTVRTMLKGGGDPNESDSNGWSPIHMLCVKPLNASPESPPYKKEKEAWEGLMKAVLDLGADINQRDARGVTPLMLMAKFGNLDLVKWMLKHEADANRKDRSKRTALHAAVEGQHKHVCLELLKAGADPNAGDGEECGSCFDKAIGDDALLTMLEEYRDVNARESQSLETILRRRPPIYIKDIEDFPTLAQKHIKISEIPKEKLIQHMDILIYCLRFLLKQNFKLFGEDEDKAQPPPKSVPKTMELLSSTVDDVLTRYVDNGNPRKMFKLIDESGHGGFGSVYVAKAVNSKEKIAIKRMCHEGDKEMRNNADEIVHLKKCDHPNICKYYNCYVSRGEMWIVMEYLEGGTLSQASEVAHLDEKQIAYVTQEILKGLKYMHSLNLVHRDLKSANIMMTLEGDIKLIDFGLCVDLAVGEQKSMVGSPFWIPPEMVQRKPHGKPADIWSLAILCLEMANQAPPHRRSALRAMFNAGAGEIPQLSDPGRWGKTFKDFLSKMLQTDPDERWTAEQLLQHKWLKRADSRDGMCNIIHSIFIGRSLNDSLGII